MRYLKLLALCALPVAASAQERFDQYAIACDFPTIPQVVIYYSRPGSQLEAAMTVGGRGPVVMSLGAGSARYETASLDGLGFQWSPQNDWMDVSRGGKAIRSEQGTCRNVSFGKTEPLAIK